MVFTPVLFYVFAVGTFFLTLFVISPIVDSFWFDTLEDMVEPGPHHDDYVATGQMYANMFIVLCYAMSGILVAWGYATAAKKGVSEEQEQY